RVSLIRRRRPRVHGRRTAELSPGSVGRCVASVHRVLRAVPEAALTDETPERSLKFVVAVSSTRALEEIAAGVDEGIDLSDRQMLGRDAMVVYSSATAAEIRDALTPLLDVGA